MTLVRRDTRVKYLSKKIYNTTGKLLLMTGMLFFALSHGVVLWIDACGKIINEEWNDVENK